MPPRSHSSAHLTPKPFAAASLSNLSNSSLLTFTALSSSSSLSSSPSSYHSHSTQTSPSRPTSPQPLSLPWICGSVVVADIAAVFRLTEQLPRHFSSSTRAVFSAGYPEAAGGIVVWLINWRGVLGAACGTCGLLVLLLLLIKLHNGDS